MNGKRKALDLYLVAGWGIGKPKEIPGRNPRDGLWDKPDGVLFFISVPLFQTLVRDTSVWGVSG